MTDFSIKEDYLSILKALKRINAADTSSLSQAVGNMSSGNTRGVSYAFVLDFWQICPPDNTLPEVESFSIRLEMDVVEDLMNKEEPLGGKYVMQLYLTGLKGGRQYSCSWHLDLETEEDHRYIHPRYHLTYGGKSMKDKIKNDQTAFGQLLLPVTPRIPCAPMDGILAIDFILNHFYKHDEIADVLNDSGYRKAVKESQNRLWKPYYAAIHRFFANGEKVGYGKKYLPSLLD